MRILGLLLAGLGLLWITAAGAAAAERPMGFGQNTTGGCTGPRCACHVRTPTQAAVLACIEKPGSGTVVFDTKKPIFIESPPGGIRATIKIPSNKTILGPATLISNGTIFEIRNQRNIIVRDIAFRSSLSSRPQCRDIASPKDARQCGLGIGIIGSSRDIWIDHDDFSQCGDKCIVVWAAPNYAPLVDGRVPAPDLITISNSIFKDSYFGIAIGVAARVAPAEMPAHERVTLYGNRFTNVFRRTPRAASHAWVHAFNNLVQYWGGADSCRGRSLGFGPSSVGGAEMVLENNVLVARPGSAACKRAVDVEDYRPRVGYERGTGLVRASGNIVGNGAFIAQNDPAAVFNPGSYYQYRLLPASQVTRWVTTNAGVKPRSP